MFSDKTPRRLAGISILVTLAVVAAVMTTAASAAVTEDADAKALAAPGQFVGHAPGLIITIKSVKIPKDLRPVVKFTATDERGDPIGKSELTEVRFMLAYLVDLGTGSTTRYVSYNTRIEDPDLTPNSGDEEVQATYDFGGLAATKQKGDASFTYKFATAVPADYDPSASHQLGAQFRRTFAANGVSYPTDAVFAFRPDGGVPIERRLVVDEATCNNCHTDLALHGEIRKKMQLCILCHSPQSTDANSGNTVDFPVMIHKIHMGEELPSVVGGTPYQIVGFGNSVHDYSTVAFPQDIRNCDVCHDGSADGVSKTGADTYYLDHPTMAGCGSCHDRTWFGDEALTPAGFTAHLSDVPLVDDSLCAGCHVPTAPGVKPIFEAHQLPIDTSDNPGFKIKVTGYAIMTPDTTPKLQIPFDALNGDDTPILNMNTSADFSSLSAMIGYPAKEYTTTIRNTIKGTGAVGVFTNNGNGSYTYTFNSALPLGSTDTFAAVILARRNFLHDGVTYRQGVEDNARFVFTLNGSDPVDRREVALDENCAKCHGGPLRFHGDTRVGVGTCIMCHNTNLANSTQSFNFKDMIHNIHRGEDLESANLFDEIRYPGILNDCEMCHKEGTEELPLSDVVRSTTVPALSKTILPITAACTSCHDGISAVLHAALNSDLTGGAESCVVCHGPGAAFDVEEVHALAP